MAFVSPVLTTISPQKTFEGLSLSEFLENKDFIPMFLAAPHNSMKLYFFPLYRGIPAPCPEIPRFQLWLEHLVN